MSFCSELPCTSIVTPLALSRSMSLISFCGRAGWAGGAYAEGAAHRQGTAAAAGGGGQWWRAGRWLWRLPDGLIVMVASVGPRRKRAGAQGEALGTLHCRSAPGPGQCPSPWPWIALLRLRSGGDTSKGCGALGGPGVLLQAEEEEIGLIRLESELSFQAELPGTARNRAVAARRSAAPHVGTPIRPGAHGSVHQQHEI